jgi:hypothetical protein
MTAPLIIARRSLPIFAVLWVTVFSASPAPAQHCADETAVAGFRVRSVTVQARFGRAPQQLRDQLARHRGESYSSDKASEYLGEVRKFLGEQQSQVDDAVFGLTRLIKFSISTKFYDVCPLVVSEAQCLAEFKDGPTPVNQCVDIVVRTTAVQLDVFNRSSNVLPVPRSNRLNFFREIPKPLLALNPSFGLHQDRETGVSPYLGISTDLLDLRRNLSPDKSSESSEARRTRLELDLFGQKSTDESFYKTSIRLALTRTRLLKTVERLAIDAGFDADNNPLGDGRFLSNTARFGGSLSFRVPLGLVRRVILDGQYRWSSNRFFANSAALSELTSEQAFEGRALAEGRVSTGFTRMGVWFDGATPKRMPGSYRRLAVVLGYEKELPIATNQTIGIEATVGAGHAWGDVPEYARFYGGSSAGSFLYDGPYSPGLKLFPSGPLLRSFGEMQAGAGRTLGSARGGTGYWNASLNLSIPVPAWSRPLIPAEDTGPATLKQVFKNQVSSGKTLFIKSEARRRLTPEQQEALRLDENDPLTPEEREALRKGTAAYNAAQAAVTPEAEKLWAEITPITSFIADQANLYSIKPLVMFDAARLSAPGVSGNPTRFSLGGGLQLTVVIARLEVGYMRTLSPEPGDNRGNFIARLVFQNLF